MAEGGYIHEVINTQHGADSSLQQILEKNDIIAVDMEFKMDEKRPCIIQIDTNEKIYLLDITACPQIMLLPSLKSVMESTSTKKVFHGGANDSILFSDHVYLDGDDSKRIKLKHVDDIQLMTRARDMVQSSTVVDPKRLDVLCKEYGIVFPNPDDKIQRQGKCEWFGERHNNEMSTELQKYAADDVSVVLPVYREILKKGFMEDDKIKKQYAELLAIHIYREGHRPNRRERKNNWMKEKKSAATQRKRDYYHREAKERSGSPPKQSKP